ncbi:MAG: hypothetical protein R2843_10910 [Thermomicrobiales bacterium]
MAVEQFQVPQQQQGLFSRRNKGIFGKSLSYIALLGLLALIGIPVFWMLSGSLKTTQEIQAIPIQWLPSSLQWENFRDAWNAAPFDRFYINTIVTTAFGSGLELINATLTAYALAFLRFPKKTLVFILILVALMIPDEVVVPSELPQCVEPAAARLELGQHLSGHHPGRWWRSARSSSPGVHGFAA